MKGVSQKDIHSAIIDPYKKRREYIEKHIFGKSDGTLKHFKPIEGDPIHWFHANGTTFKERTKTFTSFVKRGEVVQIFITNEMKIETESLSELKLKRAALSKKFKEFIKNVSVL